MSSRVQWECVGDDGTIVSISIKEVRETSLLSEHGAAEFRASVDGGEPRTPAEWLQIMVDRTLEMRALRGGGAVDSRSYSVAIDDWHAAIHVLHDLLGGTHE